MTCPILTYHSIDESGSIISTRRQHFREQMQYLWSRGYRCMKLGEYINEAMTGKVSRGKCFVLTFDDGYKNNYDVAFPVLKEFGFVATFFVVTDCLGSRAAWAKDGSIPDLPLLSWVEVREMKAHGMDIQPHGRKHRDLTCLDREEVVEEVIGSKREIEDRLGGTADVFSYPYGRCNGKAVAVVKEAGFRGAVTTRFGINGKRLDPFLIRRVGGRRFRRYPKAFGLCLNRTGCHVTSAVLEVRRWAHFGKRVIAFRTGQGKV